jgi:hypothetical protein
MQKLLLELYHDLLNRLSCCYANLDIAYSSRKRTAPSVMLLNRCKLNYWQCNAFTTPFSHAVNRILTYEIAADREWHE